MKKISNWFIAAVMMTAAFTSSAYEKSLPVGSRAALVSQAIRDVKGINGSLWAQGNLQPTNGSGYFWVEYNSPTPKKDEIRALIAAQQLSYRVMSPSNDWLGFYVSCYNAEGYQLFYGGNGFRLEYGKGGWQVPEAARQFDVMLAWQIPIKLKGAIGARIVVRNDDGYITSEFGLRVDYNYQNDMGTVFMLSEYSGLGSRGQLIVTYLERQPDGNSRTIDVVYSLSGDGEVLATEDGTTSVRPNMSDVVILTAIHAFMTNIDSKDHVGTVPLGELTVPFKSWNYFHASTKEGDIATAVRILKLGEADAQWQETTMAPGVPYVPVLLEPGVYHVDYDIPGLHPPVPYQSTPVVGGGGGKG